MAQSVESNTHNMEENNGAPRTGWERYVADAAPQGALGTVRIAALLRIVAAHNAAGMKLNEIARLAGLEQSTAHRIVTALHSVGFLAREENGRRYHLGPLLFELFTTAFPHFNPVEICEPAMTALASRMGDTVYLSVRNGLDSLCVARREGSFPIRTCTVEVGQRRPLGVGAGSLAILSALPDTEARLIIEQCAPRYPDFGMTAQNVIDGIARMRENGHIYQEAVTSSDVMAVSLPITGRTGHPYGALSITATASRMTPEHARETIDAMHKEIAAIQDRISDLGYV
ncbi:transcriptional regulator, IclR family [Maritimibacter sp. HL-12]|nr:transcriptional regulator, IclR family [Maritimibacter sp. HL-12]